MAILSLFIFARSSRHPNTKNVKAKAIITSGSSSVMSITRTFRAIAMIATRTTVLQSHMRFAISRSLGDCACPFLQARGFFDPREDHDSGLIQQSTGERVAAPRYPTTTIDFTRLILSWRKPEDGPY